MIGHAKALEIAREQLRQAPVLQDPLFEPWERAVLRDPVLVRDLSLQPSYWLVPVVIRDRAVGFVRIMGSGTVAAVGTFYQSAGEIDSCPSTVTGIDAAEADRRARKRVRSDMGETASEPVFVHDGPPGREAWRIETAQAGKPTRWIFVTPGFVYERAAGELLDEDLE